MTLDSLSNPLVTVEQLSTSSSQLDGLSAELESSIRLRGAQLTQAAGILLGLPQEITAHAIIIFTRFYTGSEGGSFLINDAKDVSAAALYTVSKITAFPQSPRSILQVYAYLVSDNSCLIPRSLNEPLEPDQGSHYLSEGAYISARMKLLQTEAIILRTLSFIIRVVTPHHLALTFLQTLGVLPTSPTKKSQTLAARTIDYLNTALFSPQLLYLTHQPVAIAVAAIYLAAREVSVKLPSCEWWEVFDVEREELGFLVVGLGSCGIWIEQVQQTWATSKCPLTAEEIKLVIQRNSASHD